MKVFIILRNYLIFLILTLSSLFLCVQVAFAESLDSYCIKKESESSAFKYRSPERTLKLTFSVKGEPFHLVADGSMVYLKRGNEDKPLMGVYPIQYDYGGIEDLALSKKGWLLINATERDYIAHVDLDSFPPILSHAEELSELKRKPCSIFNISFACSEAAQGRYSSVLDRIFVSGYRDTLFGSKDRVIFEIVDGKKRKLPRILQSAKYQGDMPPLNGAIFGSASGESLLYDGSAVTNVLKDFKNQLVKKKPTGWYFTRLISNRMFFANGGRFPGGVPEYLVELKKDLTLKTVYTALSEKLSSYVRFFALPN